MKSLSPQDLYLFDTMGFVLLQSLFSESEVVEIKQCLDSLDSPNSSFHNTDRFDDLIKKNQLFKSLSKDHRIVSKASQVINQPLRLIEGYALKRIQGGYSSLHHGRVHDIVHSDGTVSSLGMSFHHTFHNGKLYCMFVKFLVYLDDILTDDDGPFCYVQGSHKANFSFPWDRHDTGKTYPITHYGFPSLETIHLKAGDVILLNEALMHGAIPKKKSSERWLVAFSYSPAFMSDWGVQKRNIEDIYTTTHYEAGSEAKYLKKYLSELKELEE